MGMYDDTLSPPRRTEPSKGEGPPKLSPTQWALGAVAAVVVLFLAIGLLNLLTSIKGTDTGQVCAVKEGGPFDGRDVKEVRGPGEGPKPIGAFNDQHCFPATERDSNDIIEGTPTFPTKDSVQVIADHQILFTLTQDPAKLKKFYRAYASRKWGDHPLYDGGWIDFLRQRFQPVVLDADRQTIGNYECTQLNNLCQAVQNAKEVAQGKIKAVNNTQNLTAACASIREALVGEDGKGGKLKAAFGDVYFENVRCQNLRIRFLGGVQRRIDESQELRTAAANAVIEADRRVAEATGAARVKIAAAQGARKAAFQQERAYAANPTQRQIDRIKAFCGEKGCDPRVIGGGLSGVIADVSK